MEYDRQQYLKDTGDNDVKGIAVIEVSHNDGYRVTENRGGEWCAPFWMPASELDSMDVELVGNLSSEQYLKLCQAIGVSA